MREIDPAAAARRARGAVGRHDPHRRPRRYRIEPGGAQHRDGVPVVRALPASDRRREHRLSAQGRRAGQGRDRRQGRRGRRHARPDRAARPAAARAVGRAAAAGVDRPRHRPRPRRAAARRAAVEPRRRLARADAPRVRPAASGARADDGLCHPRPDRGDDARQPHRCHGRRAYRAGRRANGPVCDAGEHRGGAGDRLAGDESAAGVDRCGRSGRGDSDAARRRDVPGRGRRRSWRGRERGDAWCPT